MKRRGNISIWIGFLTAVVAVLSYVALFARFPVTRDFPWVNLLLFLVAGVFLYAGVRRAFRRPDLYRGKVSGSILSVLSFALLALFLFGTFYHSRQLPASAGAPRVGEKAPAFTLLDKDGNGQTLATLLASPLPGGQGTVHGAVLIFYRGYW